MGYLETFMAVVAVVPLVAIVFAVEERRSDARD